MDLLNASKQRPALWGNDSDLGLDVVAIYQWMVPTLCGFLLLAIVCNCLILLSIPWIRRPLSPYLRVCISLSAADACTAFVLLVGLLLNSYLPMVVGIKWTDLLSCGSLVFEVLRLSLLLISDLHLLALAFIHCFSLLFTLQFKVKMSGRMTVCLLKCLWFMPFVALFISFSVFPNKGFLSSTCLVPFYQKFPFRLTVFLAFAVPLLLSLFMYVIMLVCLWRKRRAHLYETPTLTVPQLICRGRNLNSKKIGLTTALITGTFVVCWFPVVLWFTLACLDGCYYSLQEDFAALTVVALGGLVNGLVILKFLLNPLIYALRSEVIQAAIRSMWRNRLRRPKHKRSAAMQLQTSVFRSRLSREPGNSQCRRGACCSENFQRRTTQSPQLTPRLEQEPMIEQLERSSPSLLTPSYRS